ncbi:MAG TPA: hypothetical protein VFT53_00500 [Candidatus Saccharimonadales bacterium]|nr:hypothetical protein [Candidatus Saccharimonadales bacterium]
MSHRNVYIRLGHAAVGVLEQSPEKSPELLSPSVMSEAPPQSVQLAAGHALSHADHPLAFDLRNYPPHVAAAAPLKRSWIIPGWRALRAMSPVSQLMLAAASIGVLSLPAAGYGLVRLAGRSHTLPQKPAITTGQQTALSPAPAAPVMTTPAPPAAVPAPAPTLKPKPTAAPQPSPSPAPLPTLPAVAGKDTSYSLGVLVLKYFPLSNGGQNIDIGVTGDVGGSYASIRQHTVDITNNLLVDLPKATEYLGYNHNDPPALTYHVVNTIEHDTAVPINGTLHPGFTSYPDYYGVMSSNNICSYVDGQGVREVWLFAYQGPNKPGTNQPYLYIEESKMAGPYGDISNSYEWNDMPVCRHTYVVYTFNYGRGAAEAMHSWGHQIEAEMKTVNSTLFELFQGPNWPQALGTTGRCGSVHNPPNARYEYDWANPTPQTSDCEDWNPGGLGATTPISCAVWGCNDISDANNPQLNWQIWMWQNLPGRNNTKAYQGKQLRNWWDVHGNFDAVMGGSKRLTL